MKTVYGGYGEAPAKPLKSLYGSLLRKYGEAPCKSLILLYGSHGSHPYYYVVAALLGARWLLNKETAV